MGKTQIYSLSKLNKMTTIIKRNSTLIEVLKHWNHNNPSNIGMGRLSRKLNHDGIYVISKIHGRQDLALFNIKTSLTINGEGVETDKSRQLSFEPTGIAYKSKESFSLKSYVANWVEANKTEILIQIHYLNWFNNVEIVNLTVEETIKVLESYEYNQKEAMLLFKKLTY